MQGLVTKSKGEAETRGKTEREKPRTQGENLQTEVLVQCEFTKVKPEERYRARVAESQSGIGYILVEIAVGSQQ